MSSPGQYQHDLLEMDPEDRWSGADLTVNQLA